jgi:general secretion pathway protein A
MLARAADVPALLPSPGLAVLSRDEQAVLNELAPLWAWQAPAGATADLCQATRAQGLHCFRTSRGTLAQLAQLDRPALLVLRPEQGPPLYARLVSINARRVVLAAGALKYSLPVEMLAILWRGEFTTLWRAPEGYSQLLEPGARGPVVDALARRLASLRNEPLPPPGQVLGGPLAARLSAFQVANGLMTDGIAGPTVFMQLNRLQGLSEPRLQADPVER